MLKEALRADAEAWDLLRRAMLTPEGIQAPYPLLEKLHEFGTHFATPDGSIAVHGYKAVAELIRSSAFLKRTDSVPTPLFAQETAEEMAELRRVAGLEKELLVFLNPPDHSRIRGIVNKGFRPSHLTALRPFILDLIDQLLANIDPKQPCDIMGQFASLFAPEVVAELIGLPADERPLIASQTSRLVRGVDPGVGYEIRLDSAWARHEQANYVRQVIADRRANPRDDFITDLVRVSDEDGTISDAELTALVQILYVGGYETTSHMIGNGVAAFLTHPDQWRLLCAEPGRIREAVDELLRYDGAISLTIVVAAENAEIEGQPIEPGTVCFGMVTAANHDPLIFPDPSRFDITRPRTAHLAFSAGIHFCLGAALARMELELVFKELARRYPGMRLAQEPVTLRRVDSFHQRAYEQVMVLLDP
jgi:pimeloyl-[acyl-carrier protein] synthase